jgi:hypothetical protein
LFIDDYIHHVINYKVLENLANLSVHDKPLDYKYKKLLNILLKTPGLTAYRIAKDYGYRYPVDAQRDLKVLYDNKLIEVLDEEKQSVSPRTPNAPKPYRLSINGIFYYILNTFDISFIDLILLLLDNYLENILFTHFLYPFITEHTLFESKNDSAFYSIIVYYLRSIYNAIMDSLNSLKKIDCSSISDDGYLMKQVFVWYDNLPDTLNSGLIPNIKNFLQMTLRWDRIEDVRIIPKVNENIIDIQDMSKPQINTRIVIIRNGPKAILRQNGEDVLEFTVKNEGNFLSVFIKSDKKWFELVDLQFYYLCKEHLVNFLTKLRRDIIHSDPSYRNPIFEILSKDENYKKALEYLEKELNFNQ